MFFTPRLNHERIGGEIYFSPETKVIIGESSVSEYIADTVAKKLFVTEGGKGTLCKKITFILGFTDEIKAILHKILDNN